MVIDVAIVVGVLCNMFDFTEEEFESISKKAMLNSELKQIFEMKIKGYSITKMSMELNMSESSINRRIRQLKKKVNKLADKNMTRL